MANNTYNDGGGDQKWSTGGNWSDGSKPDATDTALLDGTTNNACNCDEAASCVGVNVTSGYSGKLDFGDSAFSHSLSGDMTFDGTGEVDCGDATITCQGDFDNKDQTTWVIDSASFLFSGTNDQDVDGSGGSLGDWEIDKSAGTVTATGAITCASLTLTDGELDLNGQTLTASGAVDFASGFTLGDMDGTINCDTFSADGQTLSSVGGYSDDVPSALGSGQSLEFDGVDDRVDCGNDGSLDITGEITLSAWIKSTDNTGDNQIISKSHTVVAEPYVKYALLNDDGTIIFQLDLGTRKQITGGTITTGQWHHVVGVYRSPNMELYVDNVSVGDNTESGAVGSNSKPVVIGQYEINNSNWFNGNIDDVRVYDKGLSDAEVEYLYTNGSSGDDPGTANLQAHWKLDGDLLDETANNNDGTLYGGARVWYLNCTTSGTLTGVTIRNCDASGGAEIDASDGTCTDGGGNSNVRFWTDPTCTITTAITMPANTVSGDVTQTANTMNTDITMPANSATEDVGMGCGLQ